MRGQQTAESPHPPGPWARRVPRGGIQPREGLPSEQPVSCGGVGKSREKEVGVADFPGGWGGVGKMLVHRTCRGGDPARPNVTRVSKEGANAGEFPVSPRRALQGAC